MKNPVKPAGIEPATFRFVAQHLNHCANAVPPPRDSLITGVISQPRYFLIHTSEEDYALHILSVRFLLSQVCCMCNINHIVCYRLSIHFFVLFFIRAIFKLYICFPTNCTQLIYFINNTLKHMYRLKF